MGSYVIGSAVLLTGTFTNPAKTPVDPTVVVVKVKDPTGVETDYTSPTNTSVGVYAQQIIPTTAGTWRYRWVGTGAAVSAGEKTFEVKPTAFT